ncbi:hypothetical protein Cni_G15807 [Canna indica]|uniref:Uncharacterized protein n=1 Tax=Canna indica TaxID=4628 RepID=A0AAQ3QC00_9LILI|nr:hypothetical protein Cni_G15807 [Canna indica]
MRLSAKLKFNRRLYNRRSAPSTEAERTESLSAINSRITVMDQHHRCPSPLSGAAVAWSPLWQPKPNASQEETVTTSAVAAAEELRQAFLQTTLELESTRVAAQEELRRMEYQALHLACLLKAATQERDEARHALLLLLHQAESRRLSTESNRSLDPVPVQSQALDEGSDVAAAEDVEESSNGVDYPTVTAMKEVEAAAARRNLPEKGRLVEAVMDAGPLLQTLMLAGPLPQWRHPPPELHSSEIPPVTISLNPKKEKDGDVSPPPTSLWNSSSSSPECDYNSSFGGGKFQNISLKNM